MAAVASYLTRARAVQCDAEQVLIVNGSQQALSLISQVLLDRGSAIANAEHNNGADIDELKITTIFVEQGATLKRFSARAKGRGNSISKPTAHIYITVGN